MNDEFDEVKIKICREDELEKNFNDSSCSSDFFLFKNNENFEESSLSDTENYKDEDYNVNLNELNDNEDDEYISEDSDSEIKDKKKRKASKKRNPYQDKRKFKKIKIDKEEKNSESDEESTGKEIEYTYLDNGFKLPTKTWNKLFPFQQTSIKWLWELHQLSCGGILGDEMGLGKTIQLICFLYGLSLTESSNVRDERKGRGPVILVCPATLMHQWVNEIDKWYPNNTVTVLHHTSPYKGSKRKLLDLITKLNGILITSYTTISICQDVIFNYDWHYVILDEGHKIRNPDAQATLAVKRFKTPHRIILSGSPIQNNLKELWSLFDFIYPGKLGTLPVFLEQFAVPITQGGYANATEVQVQIAYKCASVLRDTIKPYLLRRLKEDVKLAINLPNKNEQVLFCKLTDHQKEVYINYLKSKDVSDIVKGSTRMFVGLVNLRKISNHPDLFTNGPKSTDELDQTDDYYGNYKKSGKMKVLNSLLKQWYKQNHKVLLFTQGRQMLNILEKFIKLKEYTYLVMDGTTSVSQRPHLIKQFNKDQNIFIFLLTTRVGGLGVNLTGADRIIIFDPDWNPSTDMQARERAWRIGQDRQVTIYRLLTTGTVEEKIYHRQIFKQYLTNKILKNPKQRRFFKTNDLYELFTLGNDEKRSESSDIFAGTGSEVRLQKKKKKDSKKSLDEEIKLPPEKIEELRLKAKQLSKMLSDQFNGIPSTSTTEKSEKENTKNTSSKTKGTVFEGKRIKFLDKCDEFKEQIEEEDELSKKQDEYVLKKLFKNSSLHSALQHDVIEGVTSNDYIIVENEAERVATEAIKALQRSRELCLSASSGLPNWTGQNGYAKSTNSKVNNRPAFGKTEASTSSFKKLSRPAFGKTESSNSSHSKLNRPEFGKAKSSKQNDIQDDLSSFLKPDISSSTLIKKIKQRNEIFNSNKNGPTSSLNNESLNEIIDSKHENLLKEIRLFILFKAKKRGKASTSEILDNFKDKISSEETAIFKALLWKLCDFCRESEKGYWVIKQEFK